MLKRPGKLPLKRATTNGSPSSGSSRAWEVILVTTLSPCSILVFVVVVVAVIFFADVYIGPSSHWANRGFVLLVSREINYGLN